jgi:prepilin-type N-terminal cleavage/methylation domain-containing protein
MQREDRTKPAGAHRGRWGGERGFTLIELLVVMMILGILVGLVVGVGRSVMIEMNRRRTIAIQDTILAAIRAYSDKHENVYPLADTTSFPVVYNDPNFYGYIGWFSGITASFQAANAAAKSRNANLWAQLMAEPASAKVLQGLPSEAVFTPTQYVLGQKGVYKVFRDGFDFDMDYILSALGPVLVSPGPDGYFSRTPSRDYDLDNIRSDGRGR